MSFIPQVQSGKIILYCLVFLTEFSLTGQYKYLFFLNYVYREIGGINTDSTGSLIVRESTQNLLVQIFCIHLRKTMVPIFRLNLPLK